MATTEHHYLTVKGHITKVEMSHLALCLGFPSNLFTSFLQYTSKTMLKCSEFRKILNTGTIKKKLDYHFNRYDEPYNRKAIYKAVVNVRRQRLSFEEISTARVAFEVYSCQNGSGMVAEVGTVMEALKMTERIMSPTKLEAEIQKQQYYCDHPTRIQMYEFFDLVALCERSGELEKSIPDCRVQTGTTSNQLDTADLDLPDFDRLLMTTDQKILNHLDHQYKASLYKEVAPTPAPPDTEQVVSPAPRRDQVFTARETLRCFTPSLEHSQSQLLQARSGLSVLSDEQYRVAESNISSRQATPLSSTSHLMGYGEPLKLHFRRTPRKSPAAARADDPTRGMYLHSSPPSQSSIDTGPLTHQSEGPHGPEKSPVVYRPSYRAASRGQRREVNNARHTQHTCSSEGKRYNKELVTQQDVARCQGKIRDLEWMGMRRETEQLQEKMDMVAAKVHSDTPTHSNNVRGQSSTGRTRSKSETLMLCQKSSDHAHPLPVVMSFSELPIFKTMVQQKLCRSVA